MWKRSRQLATVQAVCIVVHWLMCHRRNYVSRPIQQSMIHKQKVRDELMNQLQTNQRCRDIIRMGPKAFKNLCEILKRDEKYYLVDVGYMLRSGLIVPYRGVRYHLKEYSSHPLQNSRELFNIRHTSLHNAIERVFGVLKKRFPIIGRNRVDENFTSKAYENIVLELHEKLGVDIDKDKANPSAKKCRHMLIGNYVNLVDLFAKDRATCVGAETSKEKCKRWDNGSGDDYETIESIDQLLSQNEVTLESVAHMDDDMDTIVSPRTTSQIPTQTVQLKRKKRKTSNAEHNPDEMIKAVHSLAEAIKEGNSMFEKSQPQVYSEQDLWNDLQAMRFEQSILTDAYLYLVENPDKRRAFFGCPLESRKDLLEMMMYGYGNR
ncbi:hypothetical protein Ddye_001761 [Dipteronia dyeriana]|uniref:DDE Tnp4 domain-containing protein n=1 Tax=Dipteronia dyeriana TaxID=168575 RepID=A0AAD9XPN2_9ROSI|nr:hypothetical protein Ddye_001761 [Dipteronia dyeriana]